MASVLRSVALASSISLAMAGAAQCPSYLDITLVPNQENELEVWLRPESDFNEVFASISFTIRWIDGQANLGSLTQEMIPYMSLGTSGSEVVNGIYRYQRYAGFGFMTLEQAGESWIAGEEVLLTRIEVLNGNSFFQISDDEFTTAISFNGAYYTSLNGQPCTGEIYSVSTGGVMAGTPAPEVTIAPNPTAGLSTIRVELAEQTDLHFELHDAAGRSVWQQTRKGRSGQHIEELHMNEYSNGVYMLHVRLGDRTSKHRIVLSGGRK